MPETQPTTPEQVPPQEAAETTEAAPQTEPPPEHAERLTKEAEAQIKQKIESTADVRIVFDILRQTDQSFLPLVANIMAEKYKEDAPDLETLKEVAGLMQELESCISEADLHKLAEMAKDPNFEGALDKKNQIINGLCLPVLKGHLTAEDVGSIVKHIALMDSGSAQEESRASSGYEGVMFYDQETDAVLINPAIFAKQYRDEKGRFLALDIEHMATHELAHGVAYKTVLANETRQNFEQQLTAPNPEFSSAMMKQVRAIIENAEEIKDSQSMHIRNVLETIKNIDGDYGKLSPEKKQQYGTLPEFRNRRLAQAAVEIIAEYTALYLESDGTFKDFAMNCMAKAKSKEFDQYLASALNISADTEQKKTAQVQDKMKSILAGLSDGSENITSILEQNPGLKRLFQSYQVFFENINPAVKGAKGLLDEEGDEFDFEDYDGYFDSFGGFEQPDKAAEPSQTKNLAVAFVDAFANEVDITKPVHGG